MAIKNEFERTFFSKKLPENLRSCKFKKIIDVYIPKSIKHPKLRLRKNGDKYELTKKEPVNDGDASYQKEQTIILTEREFNVFNQLKGKKISKKRYLYEYEKCKFCEIDVYQENLKGLVIIDFEFSSIKEKDSFKIPEFCLVEVTNEKFVAGGMLCGKSYNDLSANLKRFNYKKLVENE